MSDIFRVHLDKCGRGGVTCKCCNHLRSWRSGKMRKFRTQMSRLARTRMKRDDAVLFEEVKAW